jgi:phenylacetate-CoA ligase
LSEEDRNELWRAFEVPIFEQCLGPGGAVLAWECEAHDGLHIAEENIIVEQDPHSGLILTCLTGRRYPALRVVAGCTATVKERVCGCGHAGPMLIGLTACSAKQSGPMC